MCMVWVEKIACETMDLFNSIIVKLKLPYICKIWWIGRLMKNCDFQWCNLQIFHSAWHVV